MTADIKEGSGLDLDPVSNPDAQEALSHAHSNALVMILPLRSGRFAIFSRSFKLSTIVDDLPTADEIRRISAENAAREHYLSRMAAESRYLGEPDDKDLARSLKQARKTPAPDRHSPDIVELDL